MSAFELFFSLFGLILGLAVASLASQASDILRSDVKVKVGWLTPMLVVFLLVDLISFWIQSFRQLQDIRIGFSSLIWTVALAVIYFFAASLVFPKNLEHWPSLDDYYLHRYRWVLGGVLTANIGLFVLFSVINADGPISYWAEMAQSWSDLVYFAALGAMMMFRNRLVHFASYAALFIGFAILAFSTPLTN